MAAAAAGEAADEGQMSEYVVSVSAVLETTGVDIPAAAKSEVMIVLNRDMINDVKLHNVAQYLEPLSVESLS